MKHYAKLALNQTNRKKDVQTVGLGREHRRLRSTDQTLDSRIQEQQLRVRETSPVTSAFSPLLLLTI